MDVFEIWFQDGWNKAAAGEVGANHECQARAREIPLLAQSRSVKFLLLLELLLT